MAEDSAGTWDVFLSHAQHSGQDQVSVMARELRARGLRVWWDKDTRAVDVTKNGMQAGVIGSSVFLIFLSQGYFSRPFCRLEWETAMAHGKRVLLVHEAARGGGFRLDLSGELEGVPEELQPRIKALLADHNSTKYERDPRYAEVMFNDLADDIRGVMRGLVDVARPLTQQVVTSAQVKAREFVQGTREWLIDRIVKWSQDVGAGVGSRAFVLMGGAGIGKSVLAGELCRRFDVAARNAGTAASAGSSGAGSDGVTTRLSRRLSSGLLGRSAGNPSAEQQQVLMPLVGALHFFKYDDQQATSDLRMMVLSLARQLSNVVPGMGAQLRKVDIAGLVSASPSAVFQATIVLPLQACSAPAGCSSVVVVLDALDECDKARPAASQDSALERLLKLLQLEWLQQTPKWLSLFITTRREDYVPHKLKKFNPVELNADDERNKEDMRKYLEVRLASHGRSHSPAELARAVDILAERSEGLFLYARFLDEELSECASGWTLDTIEGDTAAFPDGVDGYYAGYFGRFKRDALGGDDGLYQRLLAPMVAARAPLPLAALNGVVNKRGRDARRLVDKAQQLLYIGGGTVRFVHKSMADWLVSEDNPEDDLVVEARDGHELLAAWCVDQRADPFALEHAIYHLCSSGQLGKVPDLLLDSEWLLAAVQAGVSATKIVLDADALWLAGPAVATGGTRAAAAAQVVRALEKSTTALNHDPLELASQLCGRLDPANPVLAGLDELYRAQQLRWLKPLGRSLTPAHSNLRKIMRGHKGDVTSVALSPDGKTVVSGSYDKTVRKWSALTGEELAVLEGHAHVVTCVALSPDGKTVASGSLDKTVRLWSAQTGELLGMLAGHGESVRAVAFSPDGKALVSGCKDKVVRLWQHGAWTGTPSRARELKGHQGEVWGVALSPCGTSVLSGSGDKTLRLWSAQTGELLRVLEGHADTVTCVAFSPDGKSIASGSDDMTVRLWALGHANAEMRVLKGHKDFVRCLAFSPDGQTILSGSDDQDVWLWSTGSGERAAVLNGHDGWVTSVAFSPDGTTVVSGSQDETVRLWTTLAEQALLDLQGQQGAADPHPAHKDDLWDVVFSPDGQMVASASADRTVMLWSAQTGEQLHVLRAHKSCVRCVAFSADGEMIASGSKDHSVVLWEHDRDSWSSSRVLRGHAEDVWSVSISPDGATVVSGSLDLEMRLWSARTGMLIRVISGHTGAILTVAFSADGALIASGSADRTVRLWNAETGDQLHVLAGHDRQVCDVAFSPDQKMLTSLDKGETTRFWSVADGRELSEGRALSSMAEIQGVHTRSGPGGVGFTTDGLIHVAARNASGDVAVGEESGVVHILKLL